MPPSASPIISTKNADGNLLLIITAILYGVFTLLPNSTTQMVTWPWVALWQALVLMPIAWLLWQVWHQPMSQFRLGNGFDWLAGFMVLGIVFTTLVATFPQQAQWYALAAIAPLAALYGLMGWLTQVRVLKLLKAQAYLAIAFMILSLGLWAINTYLPELGRLESLQAIGVNRSLNLSIVALRNGFPLGHQNYVAGYLVLILPLLVGLAIVDKTWQRWLWIAGTGLGLIDLYTTSSRAGVLALIAFIIPALLELLLSRHLPRRIVVLISLLGLGLLSLLVGTNPRLQMSFASLRQDSASGSQIAYRLITHTVGWQMGLERPWAGQGLGSVPILFQRYRPSWGGREAELHFQLHSTPAQLWAEMGLWGIVLPLAGALLLIYALGRHRQTAAEKPLPPSLVWSLAASLWGYSVLSLTDYQLDVIAITGLLVIYVAVILFQLRLSTEIPERLGQSRRRRGLVGLGLGLLLVLSLWLVPFHRAWAHSSAGFGELRKENFQGFVDQLQRSQRFTPWESYYPFQLGWALGDLSLKLEDRLLANQARREAIAWFQQANQVSPYQEFGHSNLGWLQAPFEPEAAIASFTTSAQLVPAKMGVFLGLGYSLLLNNQIDLAAEAMALEIIRHPRIFTSSIWTVEPFVQVYPRVLSRLERLFAELLSEIPDSAVTAHLHLIRGTTRWWADNRMGAAEDWQNHGTEIGQALLAITNGETIDLNTLPNRAGKFALLAWQNPADRERMLAIAWVAEQGDAPVLTTVPTKPQVTALATTMEAADTFDQWIKQYAPTVEVRNERLGFGVFKRHDDGPSPTDYYVRFENIAIAKFFAELVPAPDFIPALDDQLQPYREALLAQAAAVE